MKRVLIVLMLLLMLIGCGESSERPNINKTTNERLVTIETTSEYAIEVDKKTRVMYVHYYRGGAVIMVDENGKPLRWEGKLK